MSGPAHPLNFTFLSFLAGSLPFSQDSSFLMVPQADSCLSTLLENRFRNRFKGLDLIDRVPDELWNEVRDIVQ